MAAKLPPPNGELSFLHHHHPLLAYRCRIRGVGYPGSYVPSATSLSLPFTGDWVPQHVRIHWSVKPGGNAGGPVFLLNALVRPLKVPFTDGTSHLKFPSWMVTAQYCLSLALRGALTPARGDGPCPPGVVEGPRFHTLYEPHMHVHMCTTDHYILYRLGGPTMYIYMRNLWGGAHRRH